jgi:hypothetical protein
MDPKLLEKYRAYAGTGEAQAVLFVKKYLPESNDKWIDVLEYEQYDYTDDKLQFRFVECGLYEKKLRPNYPSKTAFISDQKLDEAAYYLAVRAITWETAHRDIDNQKHHGVVGIHYRLVGVRYNENKGKYRKQPPWLDPNSAFFGASPESFRWSERQRYEYPPSWIYKIKSIDKLN